MEKFFQAIAVALIAVVLIMTLQKQGKETALLLSVLVCCMIALLAVYFVEPVLSFARKLQTMASIDPEMLSSLMKVVGIALTSEIAGLICTDAGNASIGKVVQFLGSCVVLWLSLPMLTGLLELVEGILTKL